MDKIVLFWILFGGIAFAFALAVQMRVMIAIVLRRALMARETELGRADANAAIMLAAGGKDDRAAQDPRVLHLVESYPNPLHHLRRARRASIITPVLLFALVLIGRFGIGVI